MRPIYPTRKYLLPVFVPEAKAIVDATLDPMYLGPWFMRLLRMKSVRVPPSQLLPRRTTGPDFNQISSSIRTRSRFTPKGGSQSGMMNEELLRYGSIMHCTARSGIRFRRARWMDTPFSIFALQCKVLFPLILFIPQLMECPAFKPPHHPAEMRALL